MNEETRREKTRPRRNEDVTTTTTMTTIENHLHFIFFSSTFTTNYIILLERERRLGFVCPFLLPWTFFCIFLESDPDLSFSFCFNVDMGNKKPFFDSDFDDDENDTEITLL